MTYPLTDIARAQGEQQYRLMKQHGLSGEALRKAQQAVTERFLAGLHNGPHLVPADSRKEGKIVLINAKRKF